MSDLKNIQVEHGEQSTVTIHGELPFAELEAHRAAAIADLGKNVEIDGFRKGHVPTDVLAKHLGEMTILSEMAERALAEAYPQIVAEHTLDVIGQPHVSITKLAEDNPLGFSITVATMPDVTLPEYKAIAADIAREEATVTDSELTDAIENMQRQKQAYERMQEKAQTQDTDGAHDGTTELPTPETVDKAEDDENAPLPELTDEYVKGLGDFTSADDFKAKFREHLEKEKEQETQSKHRSAITDAIIEKSEIALPQVLIDGEIQQMFGQMEQDLTRANLTMDDYLSHIGKTKEELTKEWQPAAEKRAKLQLVLNAIAEKEDISAPTEKVEHEVKHLLEHHKDADEARVRAYVASVLANEEVMQMLEKQSEKNAA